MLWNITTNYYNIPSINFSRQLCSANILSITQAKAFASPALLYPRFCHAGGQQGQQHWSITKFLLVCTQRINASLQYLIEPGVFSAQETENPQADNRLKYTPVSATRFRSAAVRYSNSLRSCKISPVKLPQSAPTGNQKLPDQYLACCVASTA